MRVKGFTLIEVLITILVISIFLGVSLASYRDFSRRQQVKVLKREITSDLRIAQKNAISGVKPTGCTGSLEGYSFEVVSGSPILYEVNAICTDPIGGSDREFLISSKTFPDTVMISAPSVNPLVFKPLSFGTNIPSGSVEVITISNSFTGSSASSLTVSINYTGEIE